MSSDRLSEKNVNKRLGFQYLQSELHEIPEILAKVREMQQPIQDVTDGSIFIPGEGGSPIRKRK